MQEQWAQSIPCRDGFDRAAAATVVVTEDNDIALIPPVVSMVWSPEQISSVVQTLTSAQLVAIARRGDSG